MGRGLERQTGEAVRKPVHTVDGRILHFETIGNHCWLVFAREADFVKPSTVALPQAGMSPPKRGLAPSSPAERCGKERKFASLTHTQVPWIGSWALRSYETARDTRLAVLRGPWETRGGKHSSNRRKREAPKSLIGPKALEARKEAAARQ